MTSPIVNNVVVEDGSESDDEEEAAFQAQVEAEKKSIEQEIINKRNTIKKKAEEAARAKNLAAQQKKERDALKLARRRQVLADLEAKRLAALQALDEEESQLQAGYVTDEVFADSEPVPPRTGKKVSGSSSRTGRPATHTRRSISIVEPVKSQSSRPPLPSTGVDMSTIFDLMDRQHNNTLKVVETALQGIAGSNRNRVPLTSLEDFAHQGASSASNDKSDRSQVIHPMQRAK